MSQNNPDIVLIEKRISPEELARLVHIRPAQGNRGMLIADALVRERVRDSRSP